MENFVEVILKGKELRNFKYAGCTSRKPASQKFPQGKNWKYLDPHGIVNQICQKTNTSSCNNLKHTINHGRAGNPPFAPLMTSTNLALY